MELTKIYNDFFNSEKAGGLVLIICTVFSLWIANSFLGTHYQAIWNFELAGHSVVYWINDGLMAIFFLLIGLELEREIYQGELSNIREALLPIFSAIGGIIVPALLFLSLNYDEPTRSGFGIPMATDIAFAIGILSLLGNKIPLSLKIFLTAIAVIDDLGAILIIAFFYSKGIALTYLSIAIGIYIVLIVLNRLRVTQYMPYIIGGIAMWYCMLHSGIHATITGVLLAFAIPYGNGCSQCPSTKIQHMLHKPVAFIILPIFALANTAIIINSKLGDILFEPYSVGILLGLILGKPIGIFVLTYITVTFKISKLPEDVNWKMIAGVGMIAGIGFTMSIFITLLAFSDETIINNAKFAILMASLISGISGYVFLRMQSRKIGFQNQKAKKHTDDHNCTCGKYSK